VQPGSGGASPVRRLRRWPSPALWAAAIGGLAYAIDEQTANKVVDGCVEVVSEGQWTKFGS